MPRIAPPTDEQASETARNMFHALQQKLGIVPNIFRTMGYAPEVLDATLRFNQAIQQNLPAKLRELAYIKTSMVNQCDYWLHYHKAFGQKAGLTTAQIDALGRYEENDLFSAQEKAVLRFAEQMTRNVRVDASAIEELKKSLAPDQLVVLAATVGLANWTNRFNEAFEVELPWEHANRSSVVVRGRA